MAQDVLVAAIMALSLYGRRGWPRKRAAFANRGWLILIASSQIPREVQVNPKGFHLLEEAKGVF